MTKLFQKGIEAVSALPADWQDLAGEVLLSLARAQPEYELTAAQIEDVKRAIAEADRSDFASDDEMSRTWKKFGL
jgi:hypothetical protein